MFSRRSEFAVFVDGGEEGLAVLNDVGVDVLAAKFGLVVLLVD